MVIINIMTLVITKLKETFSCFSLKKRYMKVIVIITFTSIRHSYISPAIFRISVTKRF